MTEKQLDISRKTLIERIKAESGKSALVALCLCDTVTDNTIRSVLSYAAFINGKKPQNWAEVTARIQSGEISAVEGIRLLGIKRCTYYILKKRESEES